MVDKFWFFFLCPLFSGGSVGCCEEIDSFLLGKIVGGWIFEVPFKAAVFFSGLLLSGVRS